MIKSDFPVYILLNQGKCVENRRRARFFVICFQITGAERPLTVGGADVIRNLFVFFIFKILSMKKVFLM